MQSSTPFLEGVVFLQLFRRIPQVAVVLGIPPKIARIYDIVSIHDAPHNLLSASVGHSIGFHDGVGEFVLCHAAGVSQCLRLYNSRFRTNVNTFFEVCCFCATVPRKQKGAKVHFCSFRVDESKFYLLFTFTLALTAPARIIAASH
jgi:hypothetical protein